MSSPVAPVDDAFNDNHQPDNNQPEVDITKKAPAAVPPPPKDLPPNPPPRAAVPPSAASDPSDEESSSGDSDDEDGSGDEYTGDAGPRTSRIRRGGAAAAVGAEEGGGGDVEMGEEEEEEGAGEEGEDGLKKLKFKKKKKEKKVDGQEEGGELTKKKKKKLSRKEKEAGSPREEEPEEYVDPATARRRELQNRIDELVKPKKNRNLSRKKGRGAAGDDDLEAMNDEAVVRLRNEMYAAADQDIDDNLKGRFAINKLKMLPQVVEMMQKVTLAESLVENGILEAVKRWLEPLEDNSLPAINIQREIFKILCNLPIETSALKSSGLGKIVYFYTKCKRVEPPIARMANQLVSDWMRPIIRRSKAFTDKDLSSHGGQNSDDEATLAAEEAELRRKVLARLGGSSGRAEDPNRRHAKIPEMLTMSFKRAPERDPKNRAPGGQSASLGSSGMTSKMRQYKKKLIAGQAASKRV